MNGRGRPAADPRAWLRPGFTDLLGVFLVVIVALLGGGRLFGDADAATHVATGAWILDHHEVPKVDPFSATHAGRPWFAHEWLSDLASARLYRACGWHGLVAGVGLVVTLAHVLLFRFLVRRGDDALVAFGSVVAAAATASSHWLARPHLLTVLFLVVWVVTLEQVTTGRWRPRALLFLPPLALVWANVHGGFLVAFIVLGCYGLGSILSRRASWVAPLGATFVAAAIATLVNPWGWRLPWHLLTFFTFHGPALKATSEFAPVAVDDRAGIILFLLAGLCAAAIGLGWKSRTGGARPFQPGTLLALGVTTAMAVASIRHVEVMAVFAAIVVSGGLSAWVRERAGPEMKESLAFLQRREEGVRGLWALAALVLLWVLAFRGFLPRAGFDPGQFPVSAVAALKGSGESFPGPVFAPDVWGGYLILEWPQTRVFVDGRWDMYGDSFFTQYADIYLARPGWSSALQEMGVTLAILPRNAPLVGPMQASEDWVRWRTDETAVVFRLRAGLRTS